MQTGIQTLRAVVADDSPVVRRRLAAMMRELPGVEVVGEAETVPDTLRLVAALKPDVLTLDWQMPGGTGADVLAKLQVAAEKPQVIVLTNFADAAFREKALRLGAMAFLDKSREFDQIPDLLETVRTAAKPSVPLPRHEVLARISRHSIEHSDADQWLDETAALVSRTLGIECCLVLEFKSQEDALFIRTGTGWGEIGDRSARLSADPDSFTGYALCSTAPVVVEDIAAEQRFRFSPQLTQRGIVSGMSARIGLNGAGFGVLAVFSTQVRNFSPADIGFLEAAANLLASGILHDRHVAELRRSQHILRTVLDNIPQRVFWKDRGSRYLGCNAPFARDAGLASPAEIVGRTDEDLVWKESAAAFCQDDRRVMDSGRPKLNYEEEQRHTHAAPRWLRVSKVPLRDATDTVFGVLGTYEDITLRKQAIESQARLITAIEQAFDSVVITDAQGTILYVNPAFQRVTGYSNAEAIGQNPRILKSGKQDDSVYARMWQTLAAGNVWHGRLVNKRKDGSLYEEDATISPVHDPAGKVINYVAVKRDVTAEVRLERQVQQSRKMESLGQLAGGVAHDFNNLLQAILGITDILLADGTLSTRQRQDLDQIRGSGRRAADLTRQLLAFSRKQSIAPVVLDLNGVLDGAQKMLSRLIGENIRLATHWAPDLPPVMADVGQIEQMLLNLAVNARDAMPAGGELTIRTARASLTEAEAGVAPEAYAGDFVCFSVADTGTGISKETMAHIFEPFFSTKEPGRGTGLGLSVVYGIAQQHRGWVQVCSKPGRGSTFTVFLPVHRGIADEVTPTARAIAQPPPRGNGERILVVEDAPDVRALAVRVLGDAGYRALAAGTVAEGLALFDRNGGDIDALFSDVVLPDRSGLVLAEELRQRQPGLPVLLCSGYADDRANWDAIEQQKFPFLQKPYLAADLLRSIDAILRAARQDRA